MKTEEDQRSILNFGYDTEGISPEESMIIHSDFKDGFRFSVQDVSIKVSDIEKIVSEAEEIFGEIPEFNYSKNRNSMHKKFLNERVRMYLVGNSVDAFGTFYTTSEEDNLALWNIYHKYTGQFEDVQIFTNSYSMNGSVLSNDTRVIKGEDFGYISEKYYPYLDVNIMFDQFFTGNENIILLVGKPGCGKSKLSTLALKYAYLNPDKLPYDKVVENPDISQFVSCAFVKSIDVLANDNFWRGLEKAPPDFCIIDDLDYMLTKRDAEVMSHDDSIKNSFLNQFLSFTDGVEKNKTKFIITTNQDYDDIDSALLRKGRLFDILELRHLGRDEAMEIWKDNLLKEDDFKNTFLEHQILAAELGSEIDKRMNNRIKNANQSYLKEIGISKVKRALEDKKISL